MSARREAAAYSRDLHRAALSSWRSIDGREIRRERSAAGGAAAAAAAAAAVAAAAAAAAAMVAVPAMVVLMGFSSCSFTTGLTKSTWLG